MRFGLTAQTVARDRVMGREHTEITLKNIDKVTAFREGGRQTLESMVERLQALEEKGKEGRRKFKLMKEKVYHPRSKWFYPRGAMADDN